MPYAKFYGLWKQSPDRSTPISAVALNHVEDGIVYATAVAEQAATASAGTTAPYTLAKDSKLSGIAPGATVNDSDVNLKNRSNHTGTQTASTISDFNSVVVSVGSGTWRPLGVGSATGVAATDRANIQAAMTSGGEVVLQAGNYNITGTALSVPSNTAVSILGKPGTIITQGTAGVHGISGVDVVNFRMEDVFLEGAGQASGGTQDAIHFTVSGNVATQYPTLKRVRTDHWGRDGISIEKPIVFTFEMVFPFHSGRHGMNLFGGGAVDGTSGTLTGVYPGGNWAAGVRLFQMAYTTLNSCAADANGISYEIDTCLGIVANACGFEEPYDFSAHNAGYIGTGWKITNSKVTISAPYMTGNVGTAMLIRSGSVVTLHDPFEGSPGNTDSVTNSPTWSIDVESGCSVTVDRPSVVTPVRYAAGSTVAIPSDVQQESIVIAVGDETTAITAGTSKVTFRMPYGFTLTSIKSSLTTASSSGLVTVDVNEAGSTILSTKLSIDASEKTSVTAATPVVISDSSLASDAEITIDVDNAGTAASGLKIYLLGTRV